MDNAQVFLEVILLVITFIIIFNLTFQKPSFFSFSFAIPMFFIHSTPHISNVTLKSISCLKELISDHLDQLEDGQEEADFGNGRLAK